MKTFIFELVEKYISEPFINGKVHRLWRKIGDMETALDANRILRTSDRTELQEICRDNYLEMKREVQALERRMTIHNEELPAIAKGRELWRRSKQVQVDIDELRERTSVLQTAVRDNIMSLRARIVSLEQKGKRKPARKSRRKQHGRIIR